MSQNENAITLIELIMVITIIGILAAIGMPEISRFVADSRVRSSSTDLVQNMKLSRAMAIKENRQYLITFDTANQRYMMGFSSNDNDLLDLNLDTFGVCKDTDGDRLPNDDSDANGDGVPDCVRVVNLSDYGGSIIFGYAQGTKPPKGPKNTEIPSSGVTFTGVPPTAEFDSDGSMDKLGSVYLQHVTTGYSYCVRISNHAGTINMWRWDGDKDNPTVTTWTELR